MKNRPLLCTCLILLAGVILSVFAGGSALIRQLRPSPLEIHAKQGDVLAITGQAYKIEKKEKHQAVYLKNNSILQIQKDQKQSFQEPNFILYTDPEIQIHIGNAIRATGELSFFQNARNPGNFDQKLYYQRQAIHGLAWAKEVEVADDSVWKIRDWLAGFRSQWKKALIEALGEKDGNVLSAMMLGEKSEMDPDTKELYQASGIGHILAISGVKTLKLDIPLVPETRINWAFVPLHIAIIYILKLCLDEEIIPRCRFPCSRGYLTKCINWQKK